MPLLHPTYPWILAAQRYRSRSGAPRELTSEEARVRRLAYGMKDLASPEALLGALLDAAKEMFALLDDSDYPKDTVLCPVPASTAGEYGGNLTLVTLLGQLWDRDCRPLLRRVESLESSLVRKKAGLPATPENDHLRTMRVDPLIPPPPAVILVDNVAASGNTMSAAAQLLREAGVGHVVGLVYAIDLGWETP